MKIGIIGAGNVEQQSAGFWQARGHKVFLTFSKTSEEVRKAAGAVGGGAHNGSGGEAVEFADVVVLATPYSATSDAIKQVGDPRAGNIIWDCNNALSPDRMGLAIGLTIGLTTFAAEEVPRLAHRARVEKGIPAPSIFEAVFRFDCWRAGKVSVFLCADDPDAKKTVASLVAEIDASPVETGPLEKRAMPSRGYLIEELYMLGMGGRIGLSVLQE
jgi:predicted dinucleotide-binding enzyme